MRQWFHRRAAHCASRCWCASAAGLMGTQGNHKRRRVAILNWVSVEGARGANWACLDPSRRSWCCFHSVLVGAAGPIHPGADVGWTQKFRGGFAWQQHSQSPSLSLSHTLSLPLTHSLTHSLTLSLSLSAHSLSHRVSLSLCLTLCLSHSHSITLSHSSLTLSLSQNLSLTLSHTLAFAGRSRGSPLLPSDTTQTDPSCSTLDPANRAVGEHCGRATSSLKQDRHLPEVVSVPGRFPADPRDWKRPRVSVHGRGSCISWCPGHMKQGASHRPMSQWGKETQV